MESDAAVGRLAVMDGVLNDVMRELVNETTGQDAEGLTTGKAAQVLLGRVTGKILTGTCSRSCRWRAEYYGLRRVQMV